MKIWRLDKRRYAEEAFRGKGALRTSGRWHREGAQVAYASEHPGVAALEKLVWLESYERAATSDYVLLSLRVDPDRWEEAADLIELLDDLHELHEALRKIQDFPEAAIDSLRDTHPALTDATEAVSAGPGVVDNLRLVDRVGALQDALQDAQGASHGEGHPENDGRRRHADVIETLVEASATIETALHELGITAGAGTPDTLEDCIDDRPAPFSGDLEALVTGALKAVTENADRAAGLLQAAREAARGGEAGCRELATHARDGYAHPLAIFLLAGAVRDGERIDTDAFTFGKGDHGDEDAGERLSQVTLGRSTILWSRDHTGALVNHPPAFECGHLDCSVIGLDATGRERLWSLALGRTVTADSIHDGDEDKREFLRDTMNLQVVQTSSRLRTYEGTPSGSFDGDVGLVKEVAQEYTKQFLRQGRLDRATLPGVITTKTVRQEIEPRIQDDVSEVNHYGDILGSNALAQCNVGVVLGTQHFGDDFVEQWAAFAGEEVARSGHGNDLDYGSRVGNEALKHMTEDQTLQAIMRFGRDEAGAVVFAHTSALREDLPVVGSGAVIRSYSRSGHAVAKTVKTLRNQTFTRADVEEHLEDEISPRQVRRVLEEFVEAGYLNCEERAGPHGAHQYESDDLPSGPAETLLPTPQHPDSEASSGGDDQPDKRRIILEYTADVQLDLDGDIREHRQNGVVTSIAVPDEPLQVTAPPDTGGEAT